MYRLKRSPAPGAGLAGGAIGRSPLGQAAEESASPMGGEGAVSTSVRVTASGANLSARKKPAAKKQDSGGWDDFDKW